MLRLPAPTLLNGRMLEAQLNAAGIASGVLLVGEQVELADLTDGDRAAAQTVLDAHPPTAQAALDAASGERSNETTIRQQAEAALPANRNDIATNDTFLTIATPTNAQLAAQVKELTRQSTRQARELNGIIRLILEKRDGTD